MNPDTNSRSNRRARTVAAGMLALAVHAAAASAQSTVNVTLGGNLHSIGATSGTTDRQNAVVADVNAEHFTASERLRLYYTLDAGTIAVPGEWGYQSHVAGATYRFALNEDRGDSLYVGGSLAVRGNGSSWSAADFLGVGLIANSEFHPAETATFRFGYRLDARRFPDLAAMNQVQHDGFASLLVSLPSRTTLIGELHAGLKSYASVITPADSWLWSATAIGGRGRMGRGSGSGDHEAVPTAPTALAAADSSRAELVSWFGRVAQSLTDRTGAWVQYMGRETFGSVPPVVIETPPLYFEDGIYDDPFASDAGTIGTGVKHHFASGMTLEAGAMRMRKDYKTTPALGLDGLPLVDGATRADTVVQANVTWGVPVLPSRTGPFELMLSLGYYFTRHESNDVFYNYRSHALGAAVSFSY